MRIKVKTDRRGLLMWLPWSRRIIAFKFRFCSHKYVFLRVFHFLPEMIWGFAEIIFSKGWLGIRPQCSINICFRILTAGWYVVTKDNERSWSFGFRVCVRADCLEAKLTPDRDLSMMFSGYPLALRRYWNFKRPLTPDGWHEVKCVNRRFSDLKSLSLV